MKNILVLDTETTPNFYSPFIYDFGYKIVSPDGKELVKRNWLIVEIFDSKTLMEKAYYSNKVKDYQAKVENGEIEKITFKKAIKQFVADSKKFKVEIISAYNLAFDMKALNATLKITYYEAYETQWLEKFLHQKNKKLLCIWNLSCETLLDTDEFREFATKNELVSDKGNYLSSAEVAYQYITNDLNFVESHTALADVEIEIDILIHILKNYKGNITYGLHYGSWRKIQKKDE